MQPVFIAVAIPKNSNISHSIHPPTTLCSLCLFKTRRAKHTDARVETHSVFQNPCVRENEKGMHVMTLLNPTKHPVQFLLPFQESWSNQAASLIAHLLLSHTLYLPQTSLPYTHTPTAIHHLSLYLLHHPSRTSLQHSPTPLIISTTLNTHINLQTKTKDKNTTHLVLTSLKQKKASTIMLTHKEGERERETSMVEDRRFKIDKTIPSLSWLPAR
eukprot:TRINITY_DN17822_c0_g1_i1.p1 TRINITY_DN17822_c0_g1~~TRINITY_DN17822_c0_g1_i1.p1  ORF type:complete len:215 (-),score=1.88 TRINITY_DN17822_c0_g1_i1:114-758(-)